MAKYQRRLARDDETETTDPATETFATIVALCGVLEPEEADRLRELLAAWLVDGGKEPEPEPAAQDRRRRRFAHDHALPRGVLPPEERYPNSARVRLHGGY